jgi:hypothetical protein
MNLYQIKNPDNIPIVINIHTINNFITFCWTNNIENIEYSKCIFTYYGDTLFYKINPNIQIIKRLKKELLNKLLTLECEMGFDYGLLKKSIFIATLDNNYSIFDLIIPKLEVNKIYFDNMTLLEFVTILFRNNDNFELIETLILCGVDINKPFRDGSLFFQNFIDSSTRMTISKITAINKKAFQLYKDEKMDEFYDIYFDYGLRTISKVVYKKYIPFLLSHNADTTFKDIKYLMPSNKFNLEHCMNKEKKILDLSIFSREYSSKETRCNI